MILLYNSFISLTIRTGSYNHTNHLLWDYNLNTNTQLMIRGPTNVLVREEAVSGREGMCYEFGSKATALLL